MTKSKITAQQISKAIDDAVALGANPAEAKSFGDKLWQAWLSTLTRSEVRHVEMQSAIDAVVAQWFQARMPMLLKPFLFSAAVLKRGLA